MCQWVNLCICVGVVILTPRFEFTIHHMLPLKRFGPASEATGFQGKLSSGKAGCWLTLPHTYCNVLRENKNRLTSASGAANKKSNVQPDEWKSVNICVCVCVWERDFTGGGRREEWRARESVINCTVTALLALCPLLDCSVTSLCVHPCLRKRQLEQSNHSTLKKTASNTHGSWQKCSF